MWVLSFLFNFSASLPRYINHWNKLNLGSCVIFIGKYSQLLLIFAGFADFVLLILVLGVFCCHILFTCTA